MAKTLTNKGTVLVTGASGFVGSYTAQALSSSGYRVRIFDREVCPFLQDDQEMIIGDITDAQQVMDATKGCDYIYHFAGIADIEEARARPVDTCRINIEGTLNVLEAAKEHNIKRFVFASTVYVYSDRGAFYRVSKQACENYIETYQKTYDVPFTILRYGSLYGRRAGETNGIHRLISSALESDEIVYNGDPEAMREYIHVKDAARLSVEILNDSYENTHLILTGNERMRVTDLMRMIAEMLQHKPELKFGEKTLGAHYTMTPYSYNPKLAQKITAAAHIDLGQGLLDCIAEIREEADPQSQEHAVCDNETSTVCG